MSDSGYGEADNKINDLLEESPIATSDNTYNTSVNNNTRPTFQSIVSSQRQQKLRQGFEEIKRHRWFISIANWSDVNEKRIKPPFRPELMHDGDTRNFEKYETPDFSKTDGVSDKQLEVFFNF